MVSTLRTNLDDGVLAVRLERSRRLNALHASTADAFVEALRDPAVSTEVRCALVAGEGRAFCAGTDTGADLPVPGLLLAAAVTSDVDGVPTTGGAVPMLDRANALAVALADVPVPVVAAVHGAAVGLGASLALAADLLGMTTSEGCGSASRASAWCPTAAPPAHRTAKALLATGHRAALGAALFRESGGSLP